MSYKEKIEKAIKDKEENERIKRVNEVILMLEKTAEKMIERGETEREIDGLGWDYGTYIRFGNAANEREVLEWLDTQGLEIKVKIWQHHYLCVKTSA